MCTRACLRLSALPSRMGPFLNSVGKYLVNQATGTRGSLEHFLVLVLVPGQAPRREESTKSAAERFWKGRGR